MTSIRRIYLAARAAVAEAGSLTYVLGFIIMSLATTFIFIVSQDNDTTNSLLKARFSFWNPDTLINIIVLGGWITSLIICDGFSNRWFKEENQAVRTLSLPLSNGERLATILLLYLIFVPLVSFLLPFIIICLLTFIAPDFLLLPSITYLWSALGFGFIANAAICAVWLHSSFAFGKRGGWLVFAIIGLGIFYISQTHGAISETVDIPYVASLAQEDGVAGLTRYEPNMTTTQQQVIKIKYENDETAYIAIQSVFLLIMLFAGGLALTKKTA